MIYRSYRADAIRDGVRQIRIVRKAETQKGSFAVLATEAPRGERREVLLMAGMTSARDRIPVLIDGDESVRCIVGSVLLRTQGQQLSGVVGFASDKAAQAIRERYLRGELIPHLVTEPLTGVELSRGQQFQGISGPAQVLTSWRPLQVVLEAK